MTMLKNIITWQPVLTDHQAYTYQALEFLSGSKLIAYVAEAENSIRKSQGWAETRVSSVTRVLIPKKKSLSFCLNELLKRKNDIHIFASPFQEPKLILCLFFARILGLNFYLISEPYSPIGEGYLGDGKGHIDRIKAHLRPHVYCLYNLFLRARVMGIFTISKLAYDQYLAHGVPKEKLFPFAYFVPRIAQFSLLENFPLKSSPCFKVIYVGALIRRKGLDVLQDAIFTLRKKGYQVSLDIYGAGDEGLVFSDFGFISYKGLIPFGDAQEVISRYALLVLPSRYDGWGVVINEALCANVPVVYADTVGAGDVAKNFGAGLSFSSGDSRSLSTVLMSLIDDPNLLNILCSKTGIAADSLQPEVGARYMLDMMNLNGQTCVHVKPPW